MKEQIIIRDRKSRKAVKLIDVTYSLKINKEFNEGMQQILRSEKYQEECYVDGELEVIIWYFNGQVQIGYPSVQNNDHKKWWQFWK